MSEHETLSNVVDITVALSDIQFRLDVPKNQLNKFGGYNYRSAEDILAALAPFLNEHKATVIVSDEVVSVGDRIYVKATATIEIGGQTRSATGWAREPLARKGMDEAQVTGATSSYARKYALNGLFKIDDAKDADTDEHADESKKRTQSKSTAGKSNTPPPATNQKTSPTVSSTPPPTPTASVPAPAVNLDAPLSEQGWAAIHSQLDRLEVEPGQRHSHIVIELRKLNLNVPTLLAELPKSSGMALHAELKKAADTKENFLNEPTT